MVHLGETCRQNFHLGRYIAISQLTGRQSQTHTPAVTYQNKIHKHTATLLQSWNLQWTKYVKCTLECSRNSNGYASCNRQQEQLQQQLAQQLIKEQEETLLRRRQQLTLMQQQQEQQWQQLQQQKCHLRNMCLMITSNISRKYHRLTILQIPTLTKCHYKHNNVWIGHQSLINWWKWLFNKHRNQLQLRISTSN